MTAGSRATANSSNNNNANMVSYPSPPTGPINLPVLEQREVGGGILSAVSATGQQLAGLDFSSFPEASTPIMTSNNPLSPSLTAQLWYSPTAGFDGHDPAAMSDMAGGGGGSGPNMPDAAWRTWEEFVSGISFDDISGGGFQGPLFDDSQMGY